MVHIATNTPTGRGCQSLSVSREAVPTLNQCGRVGIDRDRALCRSKTLQRTAGLRKVRSFPNGVANGSNRPEAEVPIVHRPTAAVQNGSSTLGKDRAGISASSFCGMLSVGVCAPPSFFRKPRLAQALDAGRANLALGRID